MKTRWIGSPSVNEKMVPARVADLLNEKLKEFWCGLRLLQVEERDSAIAEFKSTLRGLVDQWIDSGKTNQTVAGDTPAQRSITWRSPLYPKALFETLVKFWDRNSPRVIVELNGSWTLQVGPKPQSAASQDSLHMAREFAIFEFARLLDSTSPERLYRCDGCGKYFVRERTPRKETPIYHGSFCEKCTDKGGARRTVDSRNRRTREMIGWAADAWAKWAPSRRYGTQSEWVAKQVTVKLPRGKSIKINWVTHHQPEIEAEVERREHATRKD
jgi:hypothetical protein